MISNRTFRLIGPAAMLMLSTDPAFSQIVTLVIHGKVTMDDGSQIKKPAMLQKYCTGQTAGGQGPPTKPNGEYTWRVDIERLSSKQCYLEATMEGYESTRVDLTSLSTKASGSIELPTMKLSLKGGDPYTLANGEPNDIPDKSRAAWDAAIAMVKANDLPGGTAKLQATVDANPKFALGWHNLGILYAVQGDALKSRDSFNKAAEANPKMLAPRVILTRLLIRDGDWAGASKMAVTALPLDKEHIYPELYLHQAVAEYNQKDLAAAETHAKQALDPKNKRPAPRAEYALGRILEAKGDMAGAKQHMSRYLELEPDASDAAQIKAHIDMMGTAGAPEPLLEVITR